LTIATATLQAANRPSMVISDLGAFADAQTGQLDKANNDKVGVRNILASCKAWQDKAAAAAKPKPWWKVW
jgi:hypothetical protein